MKQEQIQTKELLPGVWAISIAMVMTYLIVGEERALLIDTSYGYIDPHDAIRSITSLPYDVVITHGHFDHCGGAYLFPEKKIYMHEADFALYQQHCAPAFRKKEYEKFVSRMGEVALPEGFEMSSLGDRFFHFVEEGHVFSLGSCDVHVVELPGHTQGSIGLWIPEKELIVTTDAANPATWVFLFESTKLSTYCETLRKIQELGARYILTGHSMEVFSEKDLKAWIGVAEHPDLEYAQTTAIEFAPGVEVLICYEHGSDPKDPKRPTLFVSRDKF